MTMGHSNDKMFCCVVVVVVVVVFASCFPCQFHIGDSAATLTECPWTCCAPTSQRIACVGGAYTLTAGPFEPCFEPCFEQTKSNFLAGWAAHWSVHRAGNGEKQRAGHRGKEKQKRADWAWLMVKTERMKVLTESLKKVSTAVTITRL